jgi:hypothetical protein
LSQRWKSLLPKLANGGDRRAAKKRASTRT